MVTRRPVRHTAQQITGVVLVVVSLAAVGMSYRATAETRRVEQDRQRYVECQAAVTDQLVTALNARFMATTRDREALDRLVGEVARAQNSDDSRRALATYQQARARADADRAAHPLPDPPAARC